MLKPVKTCPGEQLIPFVIQKQGEDAHGNQLSGEVHGELRINSLGISIRLEGYGDAATMDGFGEPIFIEHYDGKLNLKAWADIFWEDPTHSIDMEGAREERRYGKCPSCGKPRPDHLGDGLFEPKSVCPLCGHVEPEGKED